MLLRFFFSFLFYFFLLCFIICFMNLTVYVVVGNLFLFLVFIFWKNFMSAKFIFMYNLRFVLDCHLCQFVFIYHAVRHSCLLKNDKWKDRSSRY